MAYPRAKPTYGETEHLPVDYLSHIHNLQSQGYKENADPSIDTALRMFL